MELCKYGTYRALNYLVGSNKRDNGLVVKALVPNPGVPCSKPLGGFKVDSAFHPSEVGKISTRNFWELCGKK